MKRLVCAGGFVLGIFGILALVLAEPAMADGAHFKKVLVVVFENTNYDRALAQAPFRDFAQGGALLTNFTAEEHPSQGNYIAMIAGDSFDIKSDKPVDFKERHLGDLLEERGRDWRVYAEDYPGGCFLQPTSGRYVRKHVPFMSFLNVSKNPTRCAKVVNSKQFESDLGGGKLPDYALYIPNLDNDGHDKGVAFAAQWFDRVFGPKLRDPAFLKDLLLIVTFDESGPSGGNKIYTALRGAGVQAGAKSAQAYTHASVLRMVEEEFGLGTLGRQDATAVRITDIWK